MDESPNPHEAADPPEPFEDYILYRFRLEEAVHLQGVVEHLTDCEGLPARPVEAIKTVHLAIATHVAAFFDDRTDSLNVFRIWRKYFQHRSADIDRWEEDLRPALKKLWRLRSSSGAHADRRIAKQNAARTALSGPEMGGLLRKFFSIADEIAREERAVPGLANAIAAWNLRPGHVEEEGLGT
jgi:hypothetical protein